MANTIGSRQRSVNCVKGFPSVAYRLWFHCIGIAVDHKSKCQSWIRTDLVLTYQCYVFCWLGLQFELKLLVMDVIVGVKVFGNISLVAFAVSNTPNFRQHFYYWDFSRAIFFFRIWYTTYDFRDNIILAFVGTVVLFEDFVFIFTAMYK